MYLSVILQLVQLNVLEIMRKGDLRQNHPFPLNKEVTRFWQNKPVSSVAILTSNYYANVASYDKIDSTI